MRTENAEVGNEQWPNKERSNGKHSSQSCKYIFENLCKINDFLEKHQWQKVPKGTQNITRSIIIEYIK